MKSWVIERNEQHNPNATKKLSLLVSEYTTNLLCSFFGSSFFFIIYTELLEPNSNKNYIELSIKSSFTGGYTLYETAPCTLQDKNQHIQPMNTLFSSIFLLWINVIPRFNNISYLA